MVYQPFNVLEKWFGEIFDEFSDTEIVPHQRDIRNLIRLTQKAAKASISKFVGRGDQGIVFKTTGNTVLKYTIDAKEAMALSKVMLMSHPNIVKSYGVWQIEDSIVYLAHNEYVPDPLNERAMEVISALGNADIYNADGMIEFLEQFDYPEAKQLSSALEHLRSLDIKFYDIQPDNFKMDGDQLKLVDISVPETSGSVSQLSLEDKLDAALLGCKPILIRKKAHRSGPF